MATIAEARRLVRRTHGTRWHVAVRGARISPGVVAEVLDETCRLMAPPVVVYAPTRRAALAGLCAALAAMTQSTK